MENWRSYLQEEQQIDIMMLLESDQIDENFRKYLRNLAMGAVMAGAIAGNAGKAVAAPSEYGRQPVSIEQVTAKTELYKGQDQKLIGAKIGDAILTAIKSKEERVKAAVEIGRKNFTNVMQELAAQAYSRLDSFMKLDDINAAAEEVVKRSNALDMNSATFKQMVATKGK